MNDGARAFHGQDDDEQGLVQVAVVKLWGLAQGFGDKIKSVLEFFQDGEFIGMHVRGGLRINPVTGGGNAVQGFSHLLRTDGVNTGLSGLQPGGAG